MPNENHLPMGISKLDKGYAVSVWAPNAVNVSIRGEFDDWSDEGVALSKEEGGIWAGHVPSLANSQQYQLSLIHI